MFISATYRMTLLQIMLVWSLGLRVRLGYQRNEVCDMHFVYPLGASVYLGYLMTTLGKLCFSCPLGISV